MGQKKFLNFAQRNNWLSIKDLVNRGAEIKEINIKELAAKIENVGLNLENIYIEPTSPVKEIHYIKGPVFLSFPIIDLDINKLVESVKAREAYFNLIVAKRDFERFFNEVDKRIAGDLFYDIFNFIFEDERYVIYQQAKKIDPAGINNLPEDFLSYVEQYKEVVPGHPVPDPQGFIDIFSCWDDEQGIPNVKADWFTSVNRAIECSLKFKQPAPIFQAKLPLSRIKEFYPQKRKNDFIILPSEIITLEKWPFYTLDELFTRIMNRQAREEFIKYYNRIDEGWFINPGGIHALSHTARVLFFTNILSVLENTSYIDMQILNYAAIFHDIGRLTDGYEPSHGVASYKKIKDWGIEFLLPEEETQIMRYIIENHSIPDRVAQKELERYNTINHARAKRLLGMFKDADALDRVRIDDLDMKFLRCPSSPRLMIPAYQLYRRDMMYINKILQKE